MEKVFVGIPCVDGKVHQDIVGAMLTASNKGRLLHVQTTNYSCLPYNFNTLLCSALNARANGITHFLMLHSDVVPITNNWLDVMVELMVKHHADILSVIIPIKNKQGFTSTAIDVEFGRTGFNGKDRPKRLTMTEVFEREEKTFTDPRIVVNTGLMLVDLRKNWVENACFQFEDWIIKGEDGVFRAKNVPEDWAYSRQARLLGAKIFATREVAVKHFGTIGYMNTASWGVKEDAINL